LAWTRAPPDTPPPKYAYKNGEFVDWDRLNVHVYELSGITASAIYEGIRGYWNPNVKQLYINSVKAHVKRLFYSMKIMGLEIPYSKEEVEKAIPELAKRNAYKENIYIRPNVFRYKPPFQKLPPGAPTTWITLVAFPRPSGLNEIHTRKCGISTWIRPTDQISPPRIKSLANLLNAELSEREMRKAGYDESIQLSIKGTVAEMGGGANICLVKEGMVITPSNRESILEGVTKDIVFRISEQSLKLKTIAREVDRTELYVADEVFSCGTGHAEITPIISIDGVPIGDGQPGEITTKIRNLYRDVMFGNKPEYMDLLTPVY